MALCSKRRATSQWNLKEKMVHTATYHESGQFPRLVKGGKWPLDWSDSSRYHAEFPIESSPFESSHHRIQRSQIAMYAIIAADGRQYKVSEGQEIQVDLRGDAKEGDKVTFDNVLLVSGSGGVQVGQPAVAGASVTAEVLGQELGDKIYIQKIRRRKNFRRRTGHRQVFTRVRIDAITA